MTPPAVVPPIGDEEGEAAGDETAPETEPETSPEEESEPSATTGGDGSEITLLQVTSADVAELQGEIGCAFATGDSTSLLVARANVGDDERASAAINHNGYGERLMSQEAGGFGALESDGGKFGGRGLTITITPGERAPGDGTETVTQSAEMLVQRADGAERTYEGEWVCGP